MNGGQALFNMILNIKCMEWFTYTDYYNFHFKDFN